MALISLFSLKSPTVDGLEFDAVLEDTFEAGITLPTYPLQSGVKATDHRIIEPRTWSMVGCVSNTPIGLDIGDFTGVLSALVPDSGVAALGLGLSAAVLSGSEDSRASQTLANVLSLLTNAQPLTVVAGDITLQNMSIQNISRTKNPVNENGLELRIDMIELPRLDLLTQQGQVPNQDQMADGDPVKSQNSAPVNRGVQVATALGAAAATNLVAFL